MASESIAHSASWAIDSEPTRARGIIVKYQLARKIGGRETWKSKDFVKNSNSNLLRYSIYIHGITYALKK